MTSLDPLRGTPAWGAGEDPRCGTSAGYTAHRRRGEHACKACKDAQAAWQYQYETRRYVHGGPLLMDSIGVRRRLQALARIGWSYPLLAEPLGVGNHAVYELTTAVRVYRSTHDRVRALYDELWDQPGPSVRAKANAERKGWPPPLAWDDDTIDDPKARPNWGRDVMRFRKPIDEIAVSRAMHGDRVVLTPQERAEVVRRLRAQGMSGAEVAARLHIAVRSVERIKKKAC